MFQRPSLVPAAAAALLLVALAPASASAMSRTVHIRTRVINHSGAEVFVEIDGDYINGRFREGSSSDPKPVDPAEFDADRFGALHRVDGVQGISARVVNDENLTHNLENDTGYKVTTGHSHHFVATFYEKVGDSYRAFASYGWMAQVNLKGVNQCHPETIIDPEGRLAGAHKRPETALWQQSIIDRSFTKEELLAALTKPLADRGITQLLGLSLSDYAQAYGNRNSATFDKVPDASVEGWTKNAPNTCLTQLWVLPPVPENRRKEVRIGALDWGAADYTFIADFTGDGIPDLASAKGKTLFMTPSRAPYRWDEVAIDTGSGSWGAGNYTYAADFDGDGKADVGSANRGSFYVRRAAKGFKAETWRVEDQWGAAGYTYVADFNGDGKADIATAIGGNRIVLRTSNGAGFNPQISASVQNRWGAAEYTRVGDFNGDGKADIASIYKKTVFVRLSTGSAFTHKEWSVPGLWGAAGYTFVGDFNGDGKSDIASINRGTIYVLLASGDGFVASSHSVPDRWGAAEYTRVGDFNGDGKADIASMSRGKVYLRLARGDGTSVAGFKGFTDEEWAVADVWGSAGYTFIGDFDGDHRSDIATAMGTQILIKTRR
ncbi:MAG: VCBS repeat-containing protein [Nannocystaceae bacterium]